MHEQDKFFVLHQQQKTRVVRPEDIIPYLAAQEYHWREGYSAYELAYRWMESDGFPPRVRSILNHSKSGEGMKFVEGFFEYQVQLRTPGHASQTDLMVFAEGADGPTAIAVEGKVREGFGAVVSKWNDTNGKERRIQYLCEVLGLFYEDAMTVKYQLVHRTASALLEAKRKGLCRAIMLVHSFDVSNRHFCDFQRFSEILGVPVNGPDQISNFKSFGDVDLALGWAADVTRLSRKEAGR